MGISGLPLLHSLNLAKNAIITLTNLIPVAHPSSPSFIIPPSLDALSNRSELALTPVLTHITLLNLSGNQLENLEGIEQIIALKHLDVSNNRVWDVYEVSRLASLPRVESVLVKGNPLTKVVKKKEIYR